MTSAVIADKMRAMTDDVASALARLEAGGAADGPPVADGPATYLDAVRLWAESLGMRPGGFISPRLARLREAFEGYAREHGWRVDELPYGVLGRCLRKLGFVLTVRCRMYGVMLSRDSARAVWAAFPGERKPKQQVRRRPMAPRRQAPLFWALLKDGRRGRLARPLVDTLGRVWPSLRVVVALLPRVSHAELHLAAKGKGRGVAGCLWRYLTHEELQQVPPNHRAGQVLPALAWGATPAHVPLPDASRSNDCPTCGAARREWAPLPLPPGFPPPPVDGT